MLFEMQYQGHHTYENLQLYFCIIVLILRETTMPI